MYIGTEEQRKKRLKELEKLNKESESDPKNNGPFTQVYQKGWERIRELSKDKQGVVAIPLYSTYRKLKNQTIPLSTPYAT
ncbi:RepA protein [Escherichia coli]|uniref:hypothetical protein n=1 Tax=Escherichia coli TaxID=562 RepID=UPI000DA42E1C|nr:hypothetical protein [Escherichia coli]SQW30187.1 RepA protein [Escherichia coli]